MSNLIKLLPSISIICAAPNSGKTNFIKYLVSSLFNEGKIKYGQVFCTSLFKGAYDFIPKGYCFEIFDENAVFQLMKVQRKQFKQTGKAEGAFLIFDDCVGQVNWSTPIMKKLISTYRQYNITIFIATQYVKAVDTL